MAVNESLKRLIAASEVSLDDSVFGRAVGLRELKKCRIGKWSESLPITTIGAPCGLGNYLE